MEGVMPSMWRWGGLNPLVSPNKRPSLCCKNRNDKRRRKTTGMVMGIACGQNYKVSPRHLRRVALSLWLIFQRGSFWAIQSFKTSRVCGQHSSTRETSCSSPIKKSLLAIRLLFAPLAQPLNNIATCARAIR
jgi:hypothetical protein